MSITTVQTMLRDAGFDPGAVDGIWGKNTRDALTEALRLAMQHPKAPGQKIIETPAANVMRVCIDPALKILPPQMTSPGARLLALTITGQESDFHHRWQVYDAKNPHLMGAARGLGQFERNGGVKGVLNHERTKAHAAEACRRFGLPPTISAVYNALHANDVLAGVFIRLLMWSSVRAIPAIGDVEAAWQFYIHEWRPGAYWNGTTKDREKLRAKWSAYYAEARRTLGL